MGSGLGSLSAAAIVEALKKMFEAQAAGAGLKIDAQAVGCRYRDDVELHASERAQDCVHGVTANPGFVY